MSLKLHVLICRLKRAIYRITGGTLLEILKDRKTFSHVETDPMENEPIHYIFHPNITPISRAQGRSGRGGPGVPVTPLCKPFLSKQPTIFRGENAMTIMFDTV